MWADVFKTTGDGPLELNVPNSESKHTGSRVRGGGGGLPNCSFMVLPVWGAYLRRQLGLFSH